MRASADSYREQNSSGVGRCGMIKRVSLIAALAACLCAPSPAAAQDKGSPPVNSEQEAHRSLWTHCVPALAGVGALDKEAYRLDSELARRVAINVERTIRVKEPKWRIYEGVALGHVFTQSWRADGGYRLNLEIHVCETPEGASQTLLNRGTFSVAMSQNLEDFGDEARYIMYPYFTWVGVRKGRMVAVVQGPGRGLATTKRFAQYALEQLEIKEPATSQPPAPAAGSVHKRLLCEPIQRHLTDEGAGGSGRGQSAPLRALLLRRGRLRDRPVEVFRVVHEADVGVDVGASGL